MKIKKGLFLLVVFAFFNVEPYLRADVVNSHVFTWAIHDDLNNIIEIEYFWDGKSIGREQGAITHLKKIILSPNSTVRCIIPNIPEKPDFFKDSNSRIPFMFNGLLEKWLIQGAKIEWFYKSDAVPARIVTWKYFDGYRELDKDKAVLVVDGKEVATGDIQLESLAKMKLQPQSLVLIVLPWKQGPKSPNRSFPFKASALFQEWKKNDILVFIFEERVSEAK